jgi:hypothetical protein
MEGRMRRIGLKGIAREMFEDKLSAIHNKHLEVQLRNAKEDQEAEGRRKPGDTTLTGNENG